MNNPIIIDGSQGEGGGQMLRTSISMSAITGRAIHVVNIRANRQSPGLKRQHLTCVRAAATICGASVTGDAIHATEITFTPGPIQAGSYRFEVGSAGSVTLVAQTILPILLCADAPLRSRLWAEHMCRCRPPGISSHAPTYLNCTQWEFMLKPISNGTVFIPQVEAK